MAKQEMTYEQAVRRLEQIVEQVENGKMGIDDLTDNLKEAQQLVKLCRDRLTKVDEEIKKILSED